MIKVIINTIRKLGGAFILLSSTVSTKLSSMFASKISDTIEEDAEILDCSIKNDVDANVTSSISATIQNRLEGAKSHVYELQIKNWTQDTISNLESLKMANIAFNDICDFSAAYITNKIDAKSLACTRSNIYNIYNTTISNIAGDIKIFTLPEEILLDMIDILITINSKLIVEYGSMRTGDTIKATITNKIWRNNG